VGSDPLRYAAFSLAQIRGSFFPHVRTALESHGVLSDVESTIAGSTRLILQSADPSAWYDEGHTVEVYESAARVRDLIAVREIGCTAVRLAMASTWRELMHVLAGLITRSPRLAFEQLPALWEATRRDAGEVRCVESTTRHATTELRGFPYTQSAAWNEVWAGHHEAMLQHLRFTGQSAIERCDPAAGLLRIRTTWDAAPTPVG